VYSGEAQILGAKDTVDRPPTGLPATAVKTETKDKADALIQDDGRIRISEMCAATGIGKFAVMAILETMVRENFAQSGCRNCSLSNTKQPENASRQNFSSAVRETEMFFCQE
jgi:hypothetical protein